LTLKITAQIFACELSEIQAVMQDRPQYPIGAGFDKAVGPLMTDGFVLFGLQVTPTIRPRKLISIKTNKPILV
jgi:hypothetical protein